jgi:transposase
MGMGRRKERQDMLWVATAELPRSGGHVFYERVNRILDQAGFDLFVEDACEKFYAAVMGRPSLAPGKYFRMLLVGYFEGIDSERGIAWRCADSLSLRGFIGVGLGEAVPDHSTVSRTRRLIDLETHGKVFSWMLGVLAGEGLIDGKTVGVDASTLEANAAMRSIVRRDTGEAYKEFLTRLAKASGIDTPTQTDLARLDRKRSKKGSNKEWESPHDPDARITKMKDGRTHLAHKVEHVADMKTGAILAVTVQDADHGDTTTIKETMIEAAHQMTILATDPESKLRTDVLSELVTDKGYHSNDTLTGFKDLNIRSYISEPDRGRRNWKGKLDAKQAVYANRRRIRGNRGKQLLRQRGLMLERPFAHTLETGAMRRVHLRHRDNILKRVLIQYAALNLSLILRNNFGNGTPRGLQGRYVAPLFTLILFWSHYESLCYDPGCTANDFDALPSGPTPTIPNSENHTSATGC